MAEIFFEIPNERVMWTGFFNPEIVSNTLSIGETPFFVWFSSNLHPLFLPTKSGTFMD